MLHAEFYHEGFKIIPAFDIQAGGLYVVHLFFHITRPSRLPAT